MCNQNRPLFTGWWGLSPKVKGPQRPTDLFSYPHLVSSLRMIWNKTSPPPLRNAVLACTENNPSLLKVLWKIYISEYFQKRVDLSHLKCDNCDKFYALMETHEFMWMNVTRPAYRLDLSYEWNSKMGQIKHIQMEKCGVAVILYMLSGSVCKEYC